MPLLAWCFYSWQPVPMMRIIQTRIDIQNIEMPSSGAESPIVSGKLVVIRGNGSPKIVRYGFKHLHAQTRKRQMLFHILMKVSHSSHLI